MNTTKTALPTTVAFLTANNQLTVLAAALAPSVLGRPSRVSPKLRHYLGPAGEQGEITGLHYDFNKRYRIHTHTENDLDYVTTPRSVRQLTPPYPSDSDHWRSRGPSTHHDLTHTHNTHQHPHTSTRLL